METPLTEKSEYATAKMPLWHIDYFELQTLEKQQVQKGLWPPPSHLKAGHQFPVIKCSLHTKQRTFLSQSQYRDGSPPTNLTKTTLIFR